MNVGFVGFGKMAEAIGRSLIESKKISAHRIYACDVNRERLELVSALNANPVSTNKEVVEKSDLVFICVKPQDVSGVLAELAEESAGKIFLSIAAGIKLAELTRFFGGKTARIMPNTPLIVGEGMSVVSFASGFSEGEKKLVLGLLDCTGKVAVMPEEKFDAVTAVSGSGPAFYSLVIDSIAHAGVKNGLSREEALLLAEQTCLGTAKLLMEKNLLPGELISMVASKGGTTEAGLLVLKELTGPRGILERAVNAAAEKSRVLGEKR